MRAKGHEDSHLVCVCGVSVSVRRPTFVNIRSGTPGASMPAGLGETSRPLNIPLVNKKLARREAEQQYPRGDQILLRLNMKGDTYRDTTPPSLDAVPRGVSLPLPHATSIQAAEYGCGVHSEI